jgi:hypothetical protein
MVFVSLNVPMASQGMASSLDHENEDAPAVPPARERPSGFPPYPVFSRDFYYHLPGKTRNFPFREPLHAGVFSFIDVTLMVQRKIPLRYKHSVRPVTERIGREKKHEVLSRRNV